MGRFTDLYLNEGRNMKSGVHTYMRPCFFMFILMTFHHCESPPSKIPDAPNNSVDTGYVYTKPVERDDGWATSSLTECSIDDSLIVSLMNSIQEKEIEHIHSVLIARAGFLVFEAYFSGTDIDQQYHDFDWNVLHHTASCTKSVTSILTGIAFYQGLLDDLDEKLPSFFPEYYDFDWAGSKAQITLKHLLTMRAGLFWNENPSDPNNSHIGLNTSNDPVRHVLELPATDPPGTRFRYNSGLPILVGGILRNRTGLSVARFSEETLFNPLEIQDYRWLTIADGFHHTGGGLYLRPRDMLKLGQLYLQDGMWQGHRVLSKDWIDLSTQNYSNEVGYGFFWWLDRHEAGNRYVDSFLAWGYGGQHIFVLRDLDLVVVMTGNHVDNDAVSWRILEEFILPSVR